MGNIFGKLTAALGPRLVGAVASAAAGWIFIHTKGAVTVDPTQVVEIGTTMIGAYAATHRLISAKTNPGDAPSGTMKDADKNALATGTPVTPVVPAQPESGAADFSRRGE